MWKMQSTMKICEICFIILSLAGVNTLPTQVQKNSATLENNRNLKLFSAYGEYPSAVEEIVGQVQREGKIDENQSLETQDKETIPKNQVSSRSFETAYQLQTNIYENESTIGNTPTSNRPRRNGNYGIKRSDLGKDGDVPNTHEDCEEETEADSYIIQKVLPKAYNIETAAESPRVITTFHEPGKPFISDLYANIIQKVLTDNDITARSVPFDVNGSGTDIKALILDDGIKTEKAPLKLLVVEGEPAVYQSDAINIGIDPITKEQRAYLEPTSVRIGGGPLVITLPRRDSRTINLDDKFINYYQCRTVDTNRPAICNKEIVKTLRTGRKIELPRTIASTWPELPKDVVIARSQNGGLWRDYISFSLEPSLDKPIDDLEAEEDRITEIKTTLDGEPILSDEVKTTEDEIKDNKPKRKPLCNDKNKGKEDKKFTTIKDIMGKMKDVKKEDGQIKKSEKFINQNGSGFSKKYVPLRRRIPIVYYKNIKEKLENLEKVKESSNLIEQE